MDLVGRVAVITGGTGALGAVVAKRFLEEGARAVVGYVAEDGAQRLITSVGKLKERLTCISSDVTREENARRLMDEAVQRHGRLDILLNIAGGFRYGPSIGETEDKDWDFMMDLNLRSTFLCIKAALKYMRERGYGRIVSVSSRSGLKGDAMVGPYAVSKAGVIILTQTVAEEVKGHNITVNAVLPSIIDTPANRRDMHGADFSKWLRPEEVAEVILFLASTRASGVTGAAIPVFGKA